MSGVKWGKTRRDVYKRQFDGDVYVENIRCFLDISREELEKRKCTVNEQDTTALIFSQKHLEALYLQCLIDVYKRQLQGFPDILFP